MLAGEVTTFVLTLLTFSGLVPLVGRSHGWRVASFIAVSGAALLAWTRWIRPRKDAWAAGTAVGAVFGTIAALMAGLH